MRASLNEISETEKFLSNQLDIEDALVFEARLLSSPVLRINTAIQKKIHLVVKAFYRKQLKQGLQVIHEDLFSNPEKTEFQNKVSHYFDRSL
jgi:hypothetical protein